MVWVAPATGPHALNLPAAAWLTEALMSCSCAAACWVTSETAGALLLLLAAVAASAAPMHSTPQQEGSPHSSERNSRWNFHMDSLRLGVHRACTWCAQSMHSPMVAAGNSAATGAGAAAGAAAAGSSAAAGGAVTATGVSKGSNGAPSAIL